MFPVNEDIVFHLLKNKSVRSETLSFALSDVIHCNKKLVCVLDN